MCCIVSDQKKFLFFLDENEKSQHAEGAECSFFGPKTLLKGKLEEGSSYQDGIYDVQSDSSTVKEGKSIIVLQNNIA